MSRPRNAFGTPSQAGAASGPSEPDPRRPLVRRRPVAWLSWLVGALAALALLWFVFGLYVAGQPLVAVGALIFGASAIVVYATATSVAWKYLFPGVAGMLLFVVFPLLYTVQIGFTNYSSNNLLTEERARAYLLDQTVVDEDSALPYTVHREGAAYRLRLATSDGQALLSPALRLDGSESEAAALAPQGSAALGDALKLRDVIALRAGLMPLQLQLSGGPVLRYAGLREFGRIDALWQALPEGAVKQLASGTVFTPNPTTGFFESPTGERVQPGFTVGIGFANYARMLLDADFRGPFVSIFV